MEKEQQGQKKFLEKQLQWTEEIGSYLGRDGREALWNEAECWPECIKEWIPFPRKVAVSSSPIGEDFSFVDNPNYIEK